MTGRHIDVKPGKQFTLEAFCVSASKPTSGKGLLGTYRHIVFETIFGNKLIWHRRESDQKKGDPPPVMNKPLQLTAWVKRHTEDIEHRAVTFIERVQFTEIERQ